MQRNRLKALAIILTVPMITLLACAEKVTVRDTRGTERIKIEPLDPPIPLTPQCNCPQPDQEEVNDGEG